MRHTVVRKILAVFAILGILLSLCACGKKIAFQPDDFVNQQAPVSLTYAFSDADASSPLTYNDTALTEFQTALAATEVTYPYPELFNYEQAIAGIHSNIRVENHAHCVLDTDDSLNLDHFVSLVKDNTAAYLDEQGTSLLKSVEDDLLYRICEIIIEVVPAMLESYPDIDRDRVYCNLGNLKVVEKGGALDFAAVEPGMVLHVNRNTAAIVGATSDANMYTVIVHETMHIIQYGCECEKEIIPYSRRVGLAYTYDGGQEYADCAWLAEGSAERMTALYLSIEPMTYKNYVNYVLSMDLSTVLNDSVPANYMETVYFYDDIERLFAPFGADTEEEKREIYHMLYSLEIIQAAPVDVKYAYEEFYGEELTTEAADHMYLLLKRPLVQTLTKQFYGNLAQAIKDNTVTQNDALFLLNLFDSTINYHLGLDGEKYAEYNPDFIAWYATVQADFLAALDNLSLDDYRAYQSHDETTETLNAGMNWLNDDKCTFLIEKFEDHYCDYKFTPTA